MKKAFFILMTALCLCAVNRATAQVTIGSLTDPQPFSILELESDNGTRGLRLPQLTTAERIAIEPSLAGNPQAPGLQVFDTFTRCVYTWNGTKWIAQCPPEGEYIPWVDMPLPVPECSPAVPPVRIMKYNLGADPDLDTPKKQMKYLAEHAFNKLDATVYGGLYQWGRKDHKHAVTATGYERYDGTTNGWHWTLDTGTPGGDITPIVDNQPAGEAKEKFIYGNSNRLNWYPLSGTNQATADALWGNGVHISTETPNEGVPGSDGKYYQKPVRTSYDPCPAGFRIPTQDEWERICIYGCNTANTGGENEGAISNITAIGKPTSKGLTWVPVVCTYNSTTPANSKCIPSTGFTANTTSSGYAVYKTSDWEAATKSGGGGVYAGLSTTNIATVFSVKSLHDEGAAAPEPLLFLPAAGYRNYSSGVITSPGSMGLYWSSSIKNGTNDTNDSRYELQLNGGTTNKVNPSAGAASAHGASIRCVVE